MSSINAIHELIMILITGGAGFIGGNFALDWLAQNDEPLINLDKLTYAGNLYTLDTVKNNPRHRFVQGDITNYNLVLSLLTQYRVRAILHFAAESHVDRSIYSPNDFIQTNIIGMFQLLEAARTYWSTLAADEQQSFRFIYISTDEVYGTLEQNTAPFTERHPHQPNSPYSASKAAADHLARAWHHTYGLPVITTHCSNNYGPYHFPEKLIPLTILNALSGKPLPIYGDGQQIRDWLYVKDHCAALRRILKAGTPGETYNIGGWNEKTNLNVVHTLCNILDELQPRQDHTSYTTQIIFVQDRPGHDRRYAIDARKLEHTLNWKPTETFETGIRKTVQWYLNNSAWTERILSGEYRQWIEQHYGAQQSCGS